MFHAKRFAEIVTVMSLTLAVAAARAHAQSSSEIMGYNALVERLGGENVPTGASVRVVHTEGLVDGAYGPNQSASQFEGKTFHAMSGPPGSSPHATNVGNQFYGNVQSMSGGVKNIWLYEASHWLYSGFLRVNTSQPPFPSPGNSRVFNNSWIGSIGETNEALRRADWTIDEYNILIVSGVGNSGNGLPLMRDSYGGLAVGKSSGGHSIVSTPPDIDGGGRMKPEIAAPGNTTSTATPRISSAAVLLLDTGLTDPSLKSNVNALKSGVIKAVLLAGATHSDLHGSPWTNGAIDAGPERGIATQPLDNVVGAGTVNVNTSHMILTGLQQPATDNIEKLTPSSLSGWDYSDIEADGSAYWLFDTSAAADEVSIVVTWNRQVALDFEEFEIASIELELWRLDETGKLRTLVGDKGIEWFSAGNVVSNSAIDNIQHLYIQGLAAGKYVLDARRVDTLEENWTIAAAWHFHNMEGKRPGPVGDLTGDGSVGVPDLLVLLGSWGPCDECDAELCPADLDGSCMVGVDDLLMLLANWG